jgi:hypothetical protein
VHLFTMTLSSPRMDSRYKLRKRILEIYDWQNRGHRGIAGSTTTRIILSGFIYVTIDWVWVGELIY